MKAIKVFAMIAFLTLAVWPSLVVPASPGADSHVLQPEPNTHNAPINSSILVDFGETVDLATISENSLPIYGAQQALITGTYTISGTQIQLTPAQPFFPGELIQSTVTTSTQTITGTSLVDMPLVWQFRTATGAASGTLFSRPWDLDTNWSEDIALGDLNADGNLDIFLGNRDAASTVWFNAGSGHFTTNGFDLGSPFINDVSLGDMDGDGDLDAIQAGIQNNRLWLNDGHGEFSYGGALFPGSAIIQQVALGDLDGDGDLDAVTITACDPFDPDQACEYAVHRIWWNDGTGDLQESNQSLGHGTAADVSLGDLDGDGDLDAMVVSRLEQGSSVWMNLGGGVFTSTQTLADLQAASVDFGDLDGDGDLDAFVAPQANTTSAVWLNDGGGTLVAGQHLENFNDVVLGDLDGDGDLDAFSANIAADKVWLNQGDATFIFSGQDLGAAISSRAALGDLDGDGDLDAATSGYDTQPTFWVNHLWLHTWMPIVQR